MSVNVSIGGSASHADASFDGNLKTSLAHPSWLPPGSCAGLDPKSSHWKASKVFPRLRSVAVS